MKSEKQKLILPKKLSEDLAEETGIHIGDGSMNLYMSGKKNHWGYVHAGHRVDDKEHRDHVKNLMKKLYGLDPYEKTQKNCTSLVYTRKNLILFKKKLGLPMGKKNHIQIPNWIMNNALFRKRCVKGLFDTDGTIRFAKKKKLYDYPEVKITNKSKNLIEQIAEIYGCLSIRFCIYKDGIITPRHPSVIWNISIWGKKNVTKFFDLVGSSNPKHYRKYKFWKRNGFYEKIKNGGTEI